MKEIGKRMAPQVGLESAPQRKRNNLERGRRHDLPSFRPSAARAAIKKGMATNSSYARDMLDQFGDSTKQIIVGE